MLALLGDADLAPALIARLDQLDARAAEREAELDAGRRCPADALERANAELIELLDALGRSAATVCAPLRAVADLGRPRRRRDRRAVAAATCAIQQALSSIDRMEVRGRDSAGIHLFVWDHGLDVDDPAVAAEIARRSADPLFQTGTVRVVGDTLGFVYKAAAEIGELGDNVRALRAAIAADDLLRAGAVPARRPRLSVLGHTRWASVGIISEPNCHPVNSDEVGRPARSAVRGRRCSTATSTTTPT